MELNPSLITEAELRAELAAIEAESIGWLPLGDGAYLHLIIKGVRVNKIQTVCLPRQLAWVEGLVK